MIDADEISQDEKMGKMVMMLSTDINKNNILYEIIVTILR